MQVLRWREVYTKKSITHALAAQMVAAAIAKANELGVKQNVAVVDDGGNLKAFARMDGAALIGIEGSQRKAYTALFGVGTAELYDRIKDRPASVVGLSHFEGFTVIGGGLPIVIDGEIVGGDRRRRRVGCSRHRLCRGGDPGSGSVGSSRTHSVLGDRLRATGIEGQQREAMVGCRLLNQMSMFGKAQSYAVTT